MIVSYCWYCCCSIVYLCSLFLVWFVGQLTFHRYFWCVEFTWFKDWFPTVDTLSFWCIGWVSVPAQSKKRKGPIVASYGWHLKVCNFPDGKITPFQENLNLRERVVLTNLKLSCFFLRAWYTAHSKPYRRKWQAFWHRPALRLHDVFAVLCQAKDETLKRKSEAPEDIG